jgi:8-oxo-dGTP pyrophosphatase MutT (NUDIX family)
VKLVSELPPPQNFFAAKLLLIVPAKAVPSRAKILIVRSDKGWSLPGGKREGSESPIETLARELKEEMRMVEDVDIQFDVRALNIDQDVLYIGTVKKKFELKVPFNEIQEFKWIDPMALIKYCEYWGKRYPSVKPWIAHMLTRKSSI